MIVWDLVDKVVLKEAETHKNLVRDVVFSGTVPSAASWLTACGVGVVALWAGTLIFQHYRETLVEAV